MTRIVVSCTTIPSRISKIHETLKSVLDQKDIKIDKIYIALAKDKKDEYIIPEICEKTERIEIVWLKTDYGPVCKLLGGCVREQDPDTIIITIDDDMIYSELTVKTLAHYCEKLPDAACGYQSFDAFTSRPPFFTISSMSNTSTETPTLVDVLMGYGGVAYRRKFFPSLIPFTTWWSSNYRLRRADDVLISGYLSMQNIPRYRICNVEAINRNLPDALSTSIMKAVYNHVYAYGYLWYHHSAFKAAEGEPMSTRIRQYWQTLNDKVRRVSVRNPFYYAY